MNCRLFGLLFALALLSGGCASVPEDSEIRRDALPFMQGKTEGFFETVAPGAVTGSVPQRNGSGCSGLRQGGNVFR